MKRSILFSFSLLVLTSNIFALTTEINLTKLPEPKVPRPLSLTYLPISATISETELSVFFDSVVGLATIKVYDAYNNIISLEIVDSATTSEVFIAANTWASGNYTLEITYGTTILSGVFTVE